VTTGAAGMAAFNAFFLVSRRTMTGSACGINPL